MTVEEVYHQQRIRMNPFQDTAVRVGEHVFCNDRRYGVARLEWKTGKPTWPRMRRRGMLVVLYADTRLYVRHSDGTVQLIDPTAKEPINKGGFTIPDHKRSIGATHPVIAGGRLYLRDNDNLFCYDIEKNALTGSRDKPLTIKLPKPAADRRTLSKEVANRPDAPFVATPKDIVPKMLSLAKVTKKDLVVDLGSGDGRIVIAAAKKYGAKAIGYEIDKLLVQESRQKAKQHKIESLVSFKNESFYKADFSRATVVTVYLFPEILKRLKPQFDRLKPGTRIVSHQFQIPGATPDKSVRIKSKATGIDHLIYLYTTPLSKAK